MRSWHVISGLTRGFRPHEFRFPLVESFSEEQVWGVFSVGRQAGLNPDAIQR